MYSKVSRFATRSRGITLTCRIPCSNRHAIGSHLPRSHIRLRLFLSHTLSPTCDSINLSLCATAITMLSRLLTGWLGTVTKQNGGEDVFWFFFPSSTQIIVVTLGALTEIDECRGVSFQKIYSAKPSSRILFSLRNPLKKEDYRGKKEMLQRLRFDGTKETAEVLSDNLPLGGRAQKSALVLRKRVILRAHLCQRPWRGQHSNLINFRYVWPGYTPNKLQNTATSKRTCRCFEGRGSWEQRVLCYDV